MEFDAEEPSPSTLIATDAACQTTSAPIPRLEQWLEILAIILLSLTTLATSWSGYQAGRWGGVQSTKYSEASALRVESTRVSTTAGQLRVIDVGLFTNWLNAYADANTELETFYRKRFRAKFMPAFEAWIASHPRQNPEAAPSPFALPEYRLSLDEKAAQLEADAARTFREGQVANQQSDDYVLNVVILASVLFFSGISQQFRLVTLRALLLSLAVILCVIGLYHIAVYPVQRPRGALANRRLKACARPLEQWSQSTGRGW